MRKGWSHAVFFCGSLFSLFPECPKSRLVGRRTHWDAADGNSALGFCEINIRKSVSSYMLDLTTLHINKKTRVCRKLWAFFAKGRRRKEKKQHANAFLQGLWGIIPVFLHSSDNLRAPTLSWDPGQHHVCVRGFSAILYQGVPSLYCSAHQASNLSATLSTQPPTNEYKADHKPNFWDKIFCLFRATCDQYFAPPRSPRVNTSCYRADNWFHSALLRPHRRPPSPPPWAEGFQQTCWCLSVCSRAPNKGIEVLSAVHSLLSLKFNLGLI